MYFGSYTCFTELILVLQILYLFYRTYSCISDLIRVLWNLYLYKSTRRYYSYSLYGGTRRYYRDFTCTKVPAGTTEQIQRYP